jgi:alanine dehydrogenase
MPDGSLPLLTPMSEVAGRMAVQEGAKFLERPMMGRGILLAGVPGVPPANVLILGGGVVGSNAARIAAGIGANVTVMDVNIDRLRYLEDVMPANVTTLYSNVHTIRQKLVEADLVIGAVLLVGTKSPVLVTREMLGLMKRGAVMVDVAVDQGGCFETTKPTTHKDPVYVVDGIVHYCVSNMPGAVAGTSTYALTNATYPYLEELADLGLERAMTEDPALLHGLTIAQGKLLVRDLADQFALDHTPKDFLFPES